MSATIAFPKKRENASGRTLEINLPGPRIWKAKHLADFLGVSVHWVYKRTETEAEDPIPRIPGVGRLSFDTQSPAFQQFMARVNERNNSPGGRKPHVEITFKEFIERRGRAYTVSVKHQVSTVNCHNSLIKNYLLPFFGQRRMVDITPLDVTDFLEGLSGVSDNTPQILYGLIRLMFDIAHQYDLIEQSPVRPKLYKPQIEKMEKPTLRADQVRAILDQLPDEQVRLFVLLLAVTGLRMGEAQALRWMNFDATWMELSITHTLYRQQLKQPKTESSNRLLRLAPSIARLLVSHRENSAFQDDGDFIFCRGDGQSFAATTLRMHLYRAMDALKIKRAKGQYGFHIFRHTAGTLLYARTRDLKIEVFSAGNLSSRKTRGSDGLMILLIKFVIDREGFRRFRAWRRPEKL